MIYWYEHVGMGLIVLCVLHYIRFYLLDGDDIVLRLIDYFKGNKHE